MKLIRCKKIVPLLFLDEQKLKNENGRKERENINGLQKNNFIFRRKINHISKIILILKNTSKSYFVFLVH